MLPDINPEEVVRAIIFLAIVVLILTHQITPTTIEKLAKIAQAVADALRGGDDSSKS